MNDFLGFNLPQPLMKALEKMKFTTPTPIQAQAIPMVLDGRDVLGSAQTGTGKTGAFGIPLVNKLLSNSRGTAIVLTPTRELATQVMDTLQQFLSTSPQIKTALLIGGDSMPKQNQQLRMRPRLIVGTPGRINDHLERGSLMLHDANFLVLDETDRMLDLGFGVQIERIVKFLPQARQTLMFSATMPANIIKMADKYLKNPERIAVGSTTATAEKIEQEVIRVPEEGKYERLTEELKAREGSIIVFVKTKYGADKMATRLHKRGFSAEAIHGDLQQRQRERVIQAFRDKKHRIMIATDIAARGLDIPHIAHVINYDLPQCPEDFIHRIGRTARAGAEGNAVTFVSPADGKKWGAIERMFAPEKANQGQGGPRNAGGSPNGAPRAEGDAAKRRRRRRRGGSTGGAARQAA